MIGLTEEQIIHIFSQVGNVVNFRLVYDRETGRPKGFGFAEYQDADSAASAVRNLNDHETMGRKLRVDFSHEGGGDDDGAPAGYTPQPAQPPNGTVVPIMTTSQQSSTLPPLPPGVDLSPGLTCPDAISQTLSSLPPTQLLDIISQMKGLVMADPNKATELLKQAPQLSYAIFQALLLMGLVDASALQSVIEQSTAPAAPMQQTLQPPQIPQAAPPPQPSFHQFASNLGSMPVSTPSTHNQLYAPPPVAASLPQQPLAAAAPPASIPPNLDKATLFQYVLGLTSDQLNAMQPAERDQILGVRQQILSGALKL